MNPLYEIAKQCVAGQSALSRLARCIEDNNHRCVLLAAANALGEYANEGYFSPPKKQSIPLKQVQFASAGKVQALIDVCRLRLEFLEEALAGALADSLPKRLRARVQRQADEFVDIQGMVESILQVVEPLATLESTPNLSRFLGYQQNLSRGSHRNIFYAEA
jgi:hypothetical protein